MPTPKTWTRHHYEDDLEGSAAAGCHLCSLMLGALMKTYTNPSHETIDALAAKHDFGRRIGLGVLEQQGQGAIIIVAPKSNNSPFHTLATCLSFTHAAGKQANLAYSLMDQLLMWRCQKRHTTKTWNLRTTPIKCCYK